MVSTALLALTISGRAALAESAPSSDQTVVDATDADPGATADLPVAPKVQLSDVTEAETIVDVSPAQTSAEDSADQVTAEPEVDASIPDNDTAQDSFANDEPASVASEAETGESADAPPIDGHVEPADEAPVAEKPSIAAEAVAQRFAAKLIGETEPEPAPEPEPEPDAPSEPVSDAAPVDQTTLAVELEEPPRPKAVVGEPPQALEQPVQEAAADLRLLGSVVKPGTAARLGWSPGVAIAGLDQPTPVLVVHGAKPGPTLCLTSAVHGDELNGIEVVRGVMYDLDPEDLSGTVIGVPIVNLQGFHRGSRYLADRRDLNRFFPGYASGSMASRIAASLFNDIIINCNMLVDIHTGSLRRANLPQLRADMRSERVVEFTKGFDNMIVVHSPGSPGMMRNAAVERGIASVTLEIGESLRIQRDEIKSGIHSINSLLEKQAMYQRLLIWGEPRPVFYNSTWLRTDRGGILESHIELGARVKKGDSLGVVIDPITNKGTNIVSDISGRVIGMAIDQVVMPGFATYHIGIESSERALGFQTEIQGRVKDAEPPTVEE